MIDSKSDYFQSVPYSKVTFALGRPLKFENIKRTLNATGFLLKHACWHYTRLKIEKKWF